MKDLHREDILVIEDLRTSFLWEPWVVEESLAKN